MSKEIIQRNKLISEFMGAKWSETNQGWLYWFDNPPTTHATHQWNDFALQYHSSWDWLMPVVEKISNIIIQEEYVRVEIIPGNYVRIFGRTGETPIMTNVSAEKPLILATWKAIVQFIKWYNTQPKNNSRGEKDKNKAT